MVNYFDNGFAVPFILGNGKESIRAASLIKRKTTLRLTVLSPKLSFFNRIRFKHIKLTSRRDDILLFALKNIAETQHEYSTPLLIYCKEFEKDFVEKYYSALEGLYVLIPSENLKFYFEGD